MSADPGSGVPMSERMQALLSRAVEDQLSEQRELANALTDVRAQLNRLADELAELRSRPADAAGVSDLRSSLADVESQVRAQGETLAGVAGTTAGLGTRLADLEGSLAQIGPMLGELGETTTDHADGLADLQSRFDTMARAVQELSDGLGARGDTGEALAGLSGKLAALQTDMTALGGEVAGLVEGAADRASVQAAVEAAQAAAARVAKMDDIAAQVSELRLHLSGPEGVAAGVEQLRQQLAAGSDEPDEARTQEVVAEAVAQAERRIAAHVDDAIVALAEALLRRRFPSGDAEPTVTAAEAEELIGATTSPDDEVEVESESDELDQSLEWRKSSSPAGSVPAAEPGDDEDTSDSRVPEPDEDKPRRGLFRGRH